MDNGRMDRGTRSPSRRRRGDLSPRGSRFYDGEDWGWQQLWLTADQVLATASREYGVNAASAALLADGYLNQSWRLALPDGDKVLRVSRTERTIDHVRYEDRLVDAWSSVIPEVVVPLSTHHPVINGHLITLYPYLAGRSGTEVDPVERAGQLAPLIARMHRISLDLDLPQRPGAQSVDHGLPSDKWIPVRRAVIDRFGAGPEVMGPVRQLDACVADLDASARSWRADGRKLLRAAVHGDLNARNQLYVGDRLVGIIDTDDCRIEPLIAEVAGLAYSAPEVSPSQVWRDYLEAGGPLDRRDEDLLLPFARLMALGELEWLTDDDGHATHLAVQGLRNIAADLTGAPVRG